MLKKHTFWLKTTIVLQLLTAVIHSASFFIKPEPANDMEKQLIDLMHNYKMEMGTGFSPTMQDLFTSMSAAFALLLFFGGITNWFLLARKAELSILRGMTSIQFFVFGVCFAVVATLTFLPPIICTGLIFISLFAARITFPKEDTITL